MVHKRKNGKNKTGKKPVSIQKRIIRNLKNDITVKTAKGVYKVAKKEYDKLTPKQKQELTHAALTAGKALLILL